MQKKGGKKKIDLASLQSPKSVTADKVKEEDTSRGGLVKNESLMSPVDRPVGAATAPIETTSVKSPR